MKNLYNVYINYRYFLEQKNFKKALDCLDEAIEIDKKRYNDEVTNSKKARIEPMIGYLYYLRYFVRKDYNKIYPNILYSKYQKDDYSTFLELTKSIKDIYIYYAKATLLLEQECFYDALENIKAAIKIDASIDEFYNLCSIINKKIYSHSNNYDITNFKKNSTQINIINDSSFERDYQDLKLNKAPSVIINECYNNFLGFLNKENDILANFWLKKVEELISYKNLISYENLILNDMPPLLLKIKIYLCSFYKEKQEFKQAFDTNNDMIILSTFINNQNSSLIINEKNYLQPQLPWVDNDDYLQNTASTNKFDSKDNCQLMQQLSSTDQQAPLTTNNKDLERPSWSEWIPDDCDSLKESWDYFDSVNNPQQSPTIDNDSYLQNTASTNKFDSKDNYQPMQQLSSIDQQVLLTNNNKDLEKLSWSNDDICSKEFYINFEYVNNQRTQRSSMTVYDNHSQIDNFDDKDSPHSIQGLSSTLLDPWKKKLPELSKQVSELEISGFIDSLKSQLWQHQKDALKEIAKTLKTVKDRPWVVEIATGGGKTRVQMALSCYLIKKNSDGIIYIVAPTSDLCDQFRQDFINFLKQFESPPIVEEEIVIVNSRWVKHKSFLENTLFNQETKIAIFCQPSFSKFLLSITPDIKIPSIILCDEYHLMINITENMVKKEMPVIAFSATPSVDHRNKRIFNFNSAAACKAGIIVPSIINTLPVRIDKIDYLKNFIDVLFKFSHPQKGLLQNSKIIIFVKNINQAKELWDEFQARKPNYAVMINSQIEDSRKIINDFRQQEWNTPIAMIAVKMLVTGYDDPSLSAVVYLKNITEKTNMATVTQMVGRSLRIDKNNLNKIALILFPKHSSFKVLDELRNATEIKKIGPGHYTANADAIMSELRNAIKKTKEPSKYYYTLIEGNELSGIDINHHLMLLLVALKKEHEEWIKLLLIHDKVLLCEQLLTILDNFPQQLNRLITLTNKKKILFSDDQSKKLSEKIMHYQPKLFQTLVKTNQQSFGRGFNNGVEKSQLKNINSEWIFDNRITSHTSSEKSEISTTSSTVTALGSFFNPEKNQTDSLKKRKIAFIPFDEVVESDNVKKNKNQSMDQNMTSNTFKR